MDNQNSVETKHATRNEPEPLHRPEYYQSIPRPEDRGKAEAIIAKQRNGPTGVVNIRFWPELMRFDDWSDPAA